MKGSFTGTTTDFLSRCYEYKRCDGYYTYTRHGDRDEGYTELSYRSASEKMIQKALQFVAAEFESEFELDDTDDDIADAIDDYLSDNITQFLDCDGYCDELGSIDTLTLTIDSEEFKHDETTITLYESQWYRYAIETGSLILPENKKRGEIRIFEVQVDSLYSESPAGCGYDTTIHIGDEFMQRAITAVREANKKYIEIMSEE